MQTYLTCPYPTYRLCLSLSLPTPLICNTQFSPNLFFCYFFISLSLRPHYNSSPNPLYRHCSANLSVTDPTPNPYVPFPEGNRGGLASCAEAQHKPLDGLLAVQQSIKPEWVQRPTTSEGMDGAEGYTS